MSINGVLEDLPLGDVLQFVHLGGRTGTLYMWQDDEHRAEIGFHDGRIVSAWAPGQKRLGDLLLERGLVEDDALEAALLVQRSEGSGRSLGQILLEQGMVTRADVHYVVKEQIKETILELVSWRHGNFHFEVDELNPVDEFALVPGELLGDSDLNTQMLLLEAARIFDERQRDGLPPPPENSPLDRHLRRAGLARSRADAPPRRGGAEGAPVEAIRCQVVSADRGLAGRLRGELPDALVQVSTVRLREAGNRLPGEAASPIVVVDLRAGEATVDDVATLSRTRPSAPVVAIAGDVAATADAYRAGAVAVAPDDEDALLAACRNLVRLLSHPQPKGTFGGLRGGFTRLRRVVLDVQSGLLPATVALNLLHVISESVERAVLFLVQRSRLVAVGAFGFSADGRPLAQATRGLVFEPAGESVLLRAMDEPEPRSVDFAAAHLDAPFGDLLGRPASGQVVVFPVMGAERTIALIYTDNGPRDEEIQDIRILELATAQVGVAFENELLRRQLEGQGFELVLE